MSGGDPCQELDFKTHLALVDFISTTAAGAGASKHRARQAALVI